MRNDLANSILLPEGRRLSIILAGYAAFAMLIFLFNHELFLLLNGWHGPVGDAVIGVVTGLGDGLVVALLASVVMLFHFRLGLAGLLAFIVSGLLAQLLKRMFDMLRPPAVFDQLHVLGAALQSHSFPSGHATSCGVMLLLVVLLSESLQRWQLWSLVGLFLLAAYGRVYVGVHFPFDVWIGLGLGVACMVMLWQWVRSWPERAWEASTWTWRISGMIVLIEASVLGLGYHVQPASAQILALILPVLALAAVMRFWKGKIGNTGSL